MAESGTLERLVIHAYKEPDYGGTALGSFEAYVNPNEITLSYEIEYDGAGGAGTTNRRMNFKSMKPGDLSLVFFIDGTGANGRPADVQEQIEKFQIVTGFNGDIHRPNYLIVMWGRLQVRKCVLRSASIAYKMFKPDGVPMRAVITAAFTDNSDDQTRIAKEQLSSPDLTHVRLTKAGDDLPSLCYAIYGDPRLYVNVARANGIEDFRNLAPGTRLFFPPLEK